MLTLIQDLKIESLTREQKLQLIDALWESLSADEAAGLTPEQLEDLDARLEFRRRNPEEGLTWEEVKARLMSER
ncbi:MAG TPA: addiction module protein [Caulifigura sp.]|jgi:putative addiction module component (TIGR02574 family)|nr:addiction module protein [Caulifigura sp.]